MTALARYWPAAALVALAALPFVPDKEVSLRVQQLTPLFVFALLGLGLNVVVGYAGLLHLGIAAFFGVGAYAAGILTYRAFPFDQSFPVVLAVAVLAAVALGVATTAPTLRLRGDYLALVTMGLGLIVTFVIRNLEGITEGTRGLNPVTPDLLPGVADPDLRPYQKTGPGWGRRWYDYPYFYFLCLGVLALTSLGLRNLERSRLGRGWVALREDELAASCMGLSPAKLKLSAIALGAGIAGLAGALFAVVQQTTGGPEGYDFNRSIIALCCVILGGLGSRTGVILGVFLLIGYDMVLTPELDAWLQKQQINPDGKQYLKVAGWRLFIFGAALIVMMRFRPEGILPAERMRHELHPEEAEAAGAAAARAEAGG
ncbi:MAG: branched-chain amino acid ABC transporter permease [Gemmataceae bacterium]|nr:branched-chain amino acid ABC transporter permease [Gemmataceae bacterium]